nr:HepT-like ribonuclease domain-containing protein [Desulfotomaculum copahuensis]
MHSRFPYYTRFFVRAKYHTCGSGLPAEKKLEQFKKVAQFRNVIVHDYTCLEPEILLGVLQKNLDDLRLFVAMIRDKFLSLR